MSTVNWKKINKKTNKQTKTRSSGILGVQELLTMHTYPQLAIKPTFRARNNKNLKNTHALD